MRHKEASSIGEKPVDSGAPGNGKPTRQGFQAPQAQGERTQGTQHLPGSPRTRRSWAGEAPQPGV